MLIETPTLMCHPTTQYSKDNYNKKATTATKAKRPMLQACLLLYAIDAAGTMVGCCTVPFEGAG